MTSKFLLISGCALAAAGLCLVAVASVFATTPVLIDHTMAVGGIWRTLFSFALFSGALHLLFVGLRGKGDAIFFCAPIAFCEAMIAMTLVGNPISFAEHSPAGNAAIGFAVLGLLLFANGMTMIILDGGLARSSQPQPALG